VALCHKKFGDPWFLEYAITMVQGNQKRQKLSGTGQLLAYADGVDLLKEYIDSMKETQKIY
jgi:hypothetical protein